ncbi:MAG: hypothetical protein V2I25_15230 [Woeseiaceae bacterium]|jgi:hypothetical protein|nr:hypothetical protein [Woeseiaceae bacterium]
MSRLTLLLAALTLVAIPSTVRASSELPPGDRPVIVKAAFMLYDVNEVAEATETFEFEGALLLNWQDPRQAFDPDAAGTTERVYKGPYQFAEVFDGWWPQAVLVNQSGPLERQGIVLRIEPDGTVWYLVEFNAVAESPMDLRYFPFDTQHFAADFKLLGYSDAEARFEVIEFDSGLLAERASKVGNAEWSISDITVSVETSASAIAGASVVGVGSTLKIGMAAERKPGYLIRVVVLPLALIVTLSWVIFWMDRESLGNRMDISFIALLTVVAFQIMVEQALPSIPGFTLMAGFIAANYLLLAATIVVNLRVDQLDRAGQRAAGDLLDRRCRWIFPSIYFAGMPLLLVILAVSLRTA